MTGQVIIQNAQVLNIVEKHSDDNKITWYEMVFMSGSDVNTITVNKNVAEELTVGGIYDLLMQITEIIKTSRTGGAYKAHKFRIEKYFEIEE